MKSVLRITFLIVFLAIMTGCVKQHNFVEGINCFRAQQYRSAFVLLKPEAVKGQPDAQYAIGYMYYYGQGVVENRKKAWFWICKAAKAGQPEAIQALKILKRTPEYPGQLMNRAHNE